MKHTTKLLFYLSLPFLLFSCGKEYTFEVENINTPEEIAFPEISAAPSPSVATNLPSTNTPPAPTAPAATPANEEGPSEKEHTQPMMNVPTFNYFTLPENSQPLFSKSCLIVESPETCSFEALQEWLYHELAKTENDLKKGEYSTQYIVFEIDKNGNVFNVEHVGSSGNTFCWPCVKSAIKTIENMPAWTPAMQNGQPINTSIKLPLRFETA